MMSNFPPPPKPAMPSPMKSNRSQSAQEAPPQPRAHQPLTDQDIPAASIGDHKLSQDETAFIIRQYLKPTQADDPVILDFIMHYLNSRSCSQAARAVGLTPHQGYALRQNPHIHTAITQITEKALMKYGYDASELIERLKEIAGLDPVEFVNPDGSYKIDMNQIAPEARRAIRKFKAKNIYDYDVNGIRQVVGELIEVELWDKMKSVELLGREKNIFKETKVMQHDVTQNMASVLLESKARAEQRQLTAPETDEDIDVTPTPQETP